LLFANPFKVEFNGRPTWMILFGGLQLNYADLFRIGVELKIYCAYAVYACATAEGLSTDNCN